VVGGAAGDGGRVCAGRLRREGEGSAADDGGRGGSVRRDAGKLRHGTAPGQAALATRRGTTAGNSSGTRRRVGRPAMAGATRASGCPPLRAKATTALSRMSFARLIWRIPVASWNSRITIAYPAAAPFAYGNGRFAGRLRGPV
jgi:hypothetical protein